MKIRPVGAELFYADRRTAMTKLRVAFRNFANAPNNYRFSHTKRINETVSVEVRRFRVSKFVKIHNDASNTAECC